MERFSTTKLREYLGIIRDVIAEGQASGAFRKDVNPTFAAKLFFGMLDEMATNWILSKRKYSLVSEAEAIADLFIAGVSVTANRPRTARRAGRSQVTATRAIRSAAVLGAGTMGAQIAAHLANAGVPTLLLDVTAQAAVDGLKRARSLSPDPVLHAEAWRSGSHRRFRHRPRWLERCDWIVEAVSSGSTSSRRCSRRSSGIRAAEAIVSSNTSGIPIAAIAEGRSDAFRRHFLGTHFFNPPRYLRLLEMIPTADTDPAVVETLTSFADRRLGKGVVIAKDTPNFIANRIGLFGVMQIFRAMDGDADD